MPRNTSGVYSLPVAAFSAGGLIRSADMNSNFSDIATALTGSLPVDGSKGMTGQLKAADGIVGAPGITFGADLDTGFYRSGAGAFTWVSDAVAQGVFGTGGLSIAGTLDVTGATTLGNLSLLGTLATTNMTLTGSLGSGTPGVSVALSSPLSPTYGGTPVYYGSGASGGSANAQTVATTVPSNFARGAGKAVMFNPGYDNTSETTLTVNGTTAGYLMKPIAGALASLSGGEVQAGCWAAAIDDGTYFQLLNAQPSPYAAYATNTTLAASQDGAVIGVTAAITLNLPAPYNGGYFRILQAASTAFTLATPSGNIYGPPAPTAAASIAIPARTAVSIYEAFSNGANWYVGALTRNGAQVPAVQRLTTVGAGTYTPSTGATWAKIRMCGGGGGGAAGNTIGAGTGSTGGTTTFGSWTAVGGNPGLALSGGGTPQSGIHSTGGADGTGTLVARQAGGPGAVNGNDETALGNGGASMFGPGPALEGYAVAGTAGINYGSGGSGLGGCGGGAEGVEFILTTLATTSIIVGTGGTGGSGSYSGGAGKQGIIVVEEFFL